MKIMAIDGLLANCNAKGVEREVNLFLMQGTPLVPGDFVLVHVGYAIQKIAAEQAHTAWELYDEMHAAEKPGTETPATESITLTEKPSHA